jgi:4-hydroxy-tetrahydrodipicolinate synthase
MYKELKESLTGCFYTIFTPFREDNNIDFESLERYINMLYRQGARKFYTMAYNSRYSQLNDDEIKNLNEFCIKTVKKLNNKNIVIVGDPIHGSTINSMEFAQHAKDMGADLISLIFREKYFDDEQILEHFSHIGQSCQFPILVHEMPFLSGADGKQMHWPKSLLSKLPQIPQIIALKEDAHDFELTKLALQLEPEIRVIIAGTKSSLMQYKHLGVQAYLNGISIINAKIGEQFWQAFEINDTNTMSFIINDLEKPFFDLIVKKYGWHRSNKALLQAADIMHRRDRLPLKHLSDDNFTEVLDVYKEIEKSWLEWNNNND